MANERRAHAQALAPAFNFRLIYATSGLRLLQQTSRDHTT